MAKVNFETPSLKVLDYRQEKGDENYGSCLWAKFYIDTDNYNMVIMSDCGNFAYGWVPTPEKETFLKLLSRINEDYLLEKIADRSDIDEEATYENIVNFLKDFDTDYCGNLYDVTEDEDFLRELKETCMDYGSGSPEGLTAALHECLSTSRFPSTVRDVMSEEYDMIEMDYPVRAKRICKIFAEYIQPAIKNMYGAHFNEGTPNVFLSCGEGVRSREECPDYGTEKCLKCNAYGRKDGDQP